MAQKVKERGMFHVLAFSLSLEMAQNSKNIIFGLFCLSRGFPRDDSLF